MTALTQFERLESGGVWRETATSDPIEVTVSFGKATLVLHDSTEQPVTHWSLPAVMRRNPGVRPALFAPAPDAEETLEIEDDLMVDAIETIRKALLKSAPSAPRLRGFVTLGILAAIIGAAAFWGPGAFMRQTLSVVPDSKRNEIGATILGHYQRLTGPTCRNPLGAAPLSKLKTRLMGRDAKGQIVVVQTLPQGATVLPGNIVLIDRALIEQLDDPAIASGFIVAAIAGRDSHDPLGDVLTDAGLNTTVQLFTTGDIPGDVLSNYAKSVQALDVTPAKPDDLRTAFDAADIPLAPYAAIRDPEGAQLGEITDGDTAPILTDSEWVRLQGICAS
ncbi:hypothetical protein MWU61_06030 [Loktanella sp. F6476L]|uniref:hypothetical protein n=1 Tax=Loktanella sp. F6476L TaxID=2926405 RepID=UPI001FF118CA|nr:hypothetical protein [Loktanella sp. F6476L]MCK0120088.1 hypothetical protein [Loktanella sp. F6476L]